MKVYLAAILVAVPLLLSACGGNTAKGPAGPLQEVIVAAVENFRFEPAEITVKANSPVLITYLNEDFAIHDWAVIDIPFTDRTEKSSGGHPTSPEPQTTIHVTADSGKTGTVQFTPTAPGRYQIICSIPGHREMGMAGTLVVQ